MARNIQMPTMITLTSMTMMTVTKTVLIMIKLSKLI